MLKISQVVGKLISNDQFLQTGLEHRLFNLSQLADFLKPEVEAELGRKVSKSAILMHLSRTQSEQATGKLPAQASLSSGLKLHTNLYMVSFRWKAALHKPLNQFFKWVYEHKGFIQVLQSDREVTLIVEVSFLEEMSKYIAEKPFFSRRSLAGIAMKRVDDDPRFYGRVLQRLGLHGIEVINCFTTVEECLVLVDQKQASKALDVLET